LMTGPILMAGFLLMALSPLIAGSLLATAWVLMAGSLVIVKPL
jgi:hypothetical protein